MSMRQVFRALLRKGGPLTCASFLFTDHSDTKKPDDSEKLRFEPPNIQKLSYQYMIQQSTVEAVNSASQTLTVTYMAIITLSDEYKTLLSELIALYKETMQFQVTDKHWDMIVELRSKVQNKKECLTKLTRYVDYVNKMAVAASEISYLSGMDSLSLTLAQRIDDALRNIKEECNSISTLEQEYCYVQEQCIRNSNFTPPVECDK